MGKINTSHKRGAIVKDGRLVAVTLSGSRAFEDIANNMQKISELLDKGFGSCDLLVNLCGPKITDKDTIHQTIGALCELPFRRMAIWGTCAAKLRTAKYIACQVSDSSQVKIFASESKALQWVNKNTINGALVSKLAAISGKNQSY